MGSDVILRQSKYEKERYLYPSQLTFKKLLDRTFSPVSSVVYPLEVGLREKQYV